MSTEPHKDGRRRRCHVFAVVTGTVLAIALLTTDCTGPRTGAGRTTTPVPSTGARAAPGALVVDLFGDSLAAQAAPDFDRILQAQGIAVRNHVFGGTAVCDWLPEMTLSAKTRPRAVVLEFSGNTFTRCMRGCPPESPAAVAEYCADLTTAIATFLSGGSHVFLMGAPIDYEQWVTHDPHWDDLNTALASLARARRNGVTYTDAGLAVERPGGAFAWTLPCLASEPCTGPVVAGVRSNVVRAPDGGHFCPPRSGSELGCAGYSSGAFRFATAMARPVVDLLHGRARTP